MKKYLVSILLLISATFTFAQVKHSITKSSITFQIKNMGITVDGSISGLKGDIQFDPAHLDASTIEASVEANTINTDNGTRDEHLKSDSYFDVAKYPKITIKSISLKHKSGNNYTGTFNLTIKDKTNTIDLPFTYVESGSTATFKGSFKIKRTDYGVGGKSFIMSNDVTILIDAGTSK
ncbi:MAG: YceI family protein [Mucilaginibacter sp.]